MRSIFKDENHNDNAGQAAAAHQSRPKENILIRNDEEIKLEEEVDVLAVRKTNSDSAEIVPEFPQSKNRLQEELRRHEQ